MIYAVAVNEAGRRIGETHPKATLTDHDVDLIRELHEEHGATYRDLADKFSVSVWSVRAICRYRVRVQVATRWKRLYSEAARKLNEGGGDDT